MIKNKFSLCFLPLLFLFPLFSFAVQDDPVQVQHADTPPVFDGSGSDACWQETTWQSIDQVWIKWGTDIPLSDNSSRYKVLWNNDANLLYFLVEVTDDVFVDGYRVNGSDGNYQFDIIEIFIDEDQSKGPHIFDTSTSNAENAFSYHIAADYPDEGVVQKNFTVGDIAGTGWGNRINPDYVPHFPDFGMTKTGNTATWELSLKVYDDSYDPFDPNESSRVRLFAGRHINLSVAVCDNDNPNERPKERDHFFGSVAVSEANHNSHWEDAEDYGTLVLQAPSSSAVKFSSQVASPAVRLFPNPAVNQFNLQIDNSYAGAVDVRVYNLLGQEVLQKTIHKQTSLLSQRIGLTNLPQGLYFVKARMGSQTVHHKLMIH